MTLVGGVLGDTLQVFFAPIDVFNDVLNAEVIV